MPALAESITAPTDGKHWVIKLRQGVTWHSGEQFTANDVKLHLGHHPEQGLCERVPGATRMSVFGSTDAYKVTGQLEITVDLPAYTIMFRELMLSAQRSCRSTLTRTSSRRRCAGIASTWLGTYTVKTSDGKSYTAHGGIGTGPWVAPGYDPARKAYKYTRNEKYWKQTNGNVKTFYVVNIQRHRRGAQRAEGRGDRRA